MKTTLMFVVLLGAVISSQAWFFPTKEVSCKACQYAVGYLDGLLVSDKSEKAIEAAVEKLCTYFPDVFKNECIVLVEKYGDKLIELAAAQISSDKVCPTLGFC
ncbi:saposin-C-like [Clytia hemisphaerica]|eukprot:TCONS_00044658-protein